MTAYIAKYTTADIRNVLLAGGKSSGKTTLAEALLHASHAIAKSGDVLSGTTVSDFEKEEKAHGHSLYSSILHLDHQGKRINLIDTPGSPELLGTTLSAMAAVETVAVVVGASGGIDVTTRRVIEYARARNLPLAVIVNHISHPNARLDVLVKNLQATFGPELLCVNLPAPGRSGVVDCLLNSEGAAEGFNIQDSHRGLLDQIVEMDESLMEKYLQGEEPNYEALHAPFEAAMDGAHLVPILFTDAKSGVGVPELLEFITRWFPSPLEGNKRPFMIGEASEEFISNMPEKPYDYEETVDGPLLAHVFKVSSDAFAGKLIVFRVHQGVCTGNTMVVVGRSKKPIKLGHVFTLQGKHHEETQRIIAGDIGAVAKIEDIHFGDVLHTDHALDTLHHKREPYPAAMFGLAIVPKARDDEAKLSVLLTRMAEEDPTFHWHTDRQTHEVVISGMGEWHLRMMLERLAARGLHVEAKPPRIAYRETITSTAEGHHRHRKQSGGSGQFGEVFLRVEPLPDDSPAHSSKGGEGFEFVNEVFGGTIPGQYIPAVEKGVRDVMAHGAIAGYALQNIRCIVYDGKHHPVDSKEIAFRTAGKYAFRDAIAKATPVLLEPIVKMEVFVPEEKLGAINSDIAGKRGRILSTDVDGSGGAHNSSSSSIVTVKVSALAPMSEVLGYAQQLKSVTSGLGSFVMELSHFDPAPHHVQQAKMHEFVSRAVEVEE